MVDEILHGLIQYPCDLVVLERDVNFLNMNPLEKEPQNPDVSWACCFCVLDVTIGIVALSNFI